MPGWVDGVDMPGVGRRRGYARGGSTAVVCSTVIFLSRRTRLLTALWPKRSLHRGPPGQ